MSMNRVAALVVVCGAAAGAFAQFQTRNVINNAGPIGSNLNGTQIVNHGLVGVGRIPAFLDAQGSTFGSVSSMIASEWRYNPTTGQYSGQFQTLPDRGRNNPATGNTVNYQGRIQKVDFTFNPLTAGNGSAQNQLQFNYRGLTMLREQDGRPLVGIDPGAAFGTAFGRTVPRNNGNITLDAEGLVRMPDGSYYVSDEYSSSIFKFDAGGVLTGVIAPPQALRPQNAAGNPDFNSLAAPARGRRNNQGMEALSLTPDGRHLIAINQSAAMQDSAGANQANRRNTRVLVYDISTEETPAEPIGHYVMTLPTFRNNGDGGAVDRTAAQSEVVAISNTQFMVLARDGNGRGPGTGVAPAFKSVLLGDLSGATNPVGTSFANGYTPIATGGVLNSSITPVSQVEMLNMLNEFDLSRFGINMTLGAGALDGDMNTLSEKWEGMSLLPDLATVDPTDYFLFLANDNDFVTQNGLMLTSDGQSVPYSDSIDNDTMFLAYKVNIIPAPGAGLLVLAGAGLVARRRR
ncbi:MAG: esterase-like activity of phytase family protein [Phycisphaerales bacterium]